MISEITTDAQFLSLCKKHRRELVYHCEPCCQFCLHEEKNRYLLACIEMDKERDELKAKLNEINCFHYNIKIGKYANMKRSKIIEQLGKLVFEKREVST